MCKAFISMVLSGKHASFSKTMGRKVGVWLCKFLFNTNHQGLQKKQNYKYQCKNSSRIFDNDVWVTCPYMWFWSVIVWKLFVSWSKGMGGWALTSLLANACTFPRTAPASIRTSRIAKASTWKNRKKKHAISGSLGWHNQSKENKLFFSRDIVT